MVIKINKEKTTEGSSLLDVLDTFIKETKPVKTIKSKQIKKTKKLSITPLIKKKKPSKYLEINLSKSLNSSFERTSLNQSSFNSPDLNNNSFNKKTDLNEKQKNEESKKLQIYEKYNKRFYFQEFKIYKNPNFKLKIDVFGKPIIEKYNNLPIIYSPIPIIKYISLKEFETVEYKLELISKKLDFN